MKRLSKVLGYILNILILFIVIIMAFAIYYFVQVKVLNKAYANIFGYTFFEVATGSMSPTINAGDVIIVKLTDDVKKDDIIVCKDNNSFVTHRLISIQDNKFIAKGDANNAEDKPMDVANLIGKVIKIIPKFSLMKNVIFAPQVFIPILVTIILLGIVCFLYDKKTKEME
mgnify:CR=1 FL=1